jgi:hypothetical protein
MLSALATELYPNVIGFGCEPDPITKNINMKKREIKKINFFKSILETQKQTCFNKKNSTQPQMKKKNYHHQTFV